MTIHPERPCTCEAQPVLVEVLGWGDVGLYLWCPACRASWHRWPEGHYYRRMAERYAAEVAA